jgi:hypothetical protein
MQENRKKRQKTLAMSSAKMLGASALVQRQRNDAAALPAGNSLFCSPGHADNLPSCYGFLFSVVFKQWQRLCFRCSVLCSCFQPCQACGLQRSDRWFRWLRCWSCWASSLKKRAVIAFAALARCMAPGRREVAAFRQTSRVACTTVSAAARQVTTWTFTRPPPTKVSLPLRWIYVGALAVKFRGSPPRDGIALFAPLLGWLQT